MKIQVQKLILIDCKSLIVELYSSSAFRCVLIAQSVLLLIVTFVT